MSKLDWVRPWTSELRACFSMAGLGRARLGLHVSHFLAVFFSTLHSCGQPVCSRLSDIFVIPNVRHQKQNPLEPFPLISRL